MSLTLTERDRAVAAEIEAIRGEYHACTAAAVAARMKLSKAYVHEVMHDMIERGLVTFSAEMPGSLRITQALAMELYQVEAARHVCDHPDCDWPNELALRGHVMRKHAS